MHHSKGTLTRSNQIPDFSSDSNADNILMAAMCNHCIYFVITDQQAVWEAATICPCPLQVDLWTSDFESGVRVTSDVATSVPILVFLDLSVLDLGPMYATGRRQMCIIA